MNSHHTSEIDAMKVYLTFKQIIYETKFRQIFKIGLFATFFLAIGCNEDDSKLSAKPESQVTHRHINFQEFSKQFPEPAARLVQQNKKSAGNILQRGEVYDAQNDFTILTDKIFMGENEGGSYYTFQITRENGDFQGLENLVLVSDGEGGFTPLLTKYSLTDEELLTLSSGGKVEALGQKMTYEALEGVDFGGSSSAKGTPCMIHIVAYCEYENQDHDGGVLPNGQPCPGHAEALVMSGDCGNGGLFGPGYSDPGPGNGPGAGTGIGTGTGTGSGPGAGSPGTGSSNGGSAPPPEPPCQGRNCPPVITSPVMEEAPIDNCEELKKLLKVPTYPVVAPNKTVPKSIAYLQGRLSGLNPPSNEEGFNFRNDARSYADAVPYADTSPTSVIYSDDPDVYGGAHIHLESLHGMFSHEDIGTLHNFATRYNYNGQAPDYSIPVHVLVTKNKTYALKIDNWSRFNVVMRAIYNNETKKRTFKRNLEKTYQNLRKTNGTSQTDYELAFLNYLKEQHIFASLYRLTTPAAPEEKQNWEKLTIGGTVSYPTVLKNPCN